MSALGRQATGRLLRVAAEWSIVALCESIAYGALAWSILHAAAPWLVLALAGIAVIGTVLVSRHGYLEGAHLAGDLYRGMGEALGTARLSWFSHGNRALVMRVAGHGILTMMGMPAHQLQTIVLSALVPFFSVLAAGAVFGVATAGIMLVLLLSGFILQIVAQRALARIDGRRQEAECASSASLVEFTDRLELFRSTVGVTRSLADLENPWVAQEKALARTNGAAGVAVLLSTIATALPLAGLLLGGALGGTSPLVLLAVLVVAARAAAPLDDLALFGISLTQVRSAFAEYRTVRAAPVLPEPAHGARAEGFALGMREVSHGPVLRDVTADIPEGATCVISGATGSGKSTLLGLLLRFTDPERGEITLGGVPLRELRYTDLAKRFALVPQDPVLFSGTISDNILLGDPQATREQIVDAVHAAGLDAVISRSTAGIDASVGDRGSALSGGERQRVALARALVKKADILLLDEPVAALDSETERVVAAAVSALPGTKIIITHRDADLWNPTQIIPLAEEGEER